MKKIYSLLMILMMIFTFAACGGDGNEEVTPPDNNEGTEVSQDEDTSKDEDVAQDEDTSKDEDVAQDEDTSKDEDVTQDEDTSKDEDASSDEEDENVPTEGTPLGWPENDYTKLVPTPNSGGKVLTSGEMGTLFSVELKWTMDQGLVYAQQLEDAGFGDDCVEKYEQYGYIDKTANGLNVQLLDLFGVASLCIMPVEE